MLISRDKHYRFLEDELRAETEVFSRKFGARALSLLEETGEIYIAQYLKIKNGEMIVKFRSTSNIPRRGEYLQCMLLPQQLRNYRNWGSLTYEQLFNERFGGSECCTIWHSAAEEIGFTLVGFSKIELEFAEIMKNAEGQILVFAPQRPPTAYLGNLQRIIREDSPAVNRLLDCDFTPHSPQPEVLNKLDYTSFILQQTSLSDTLILQGPPGTGKTYQIAKLCQALCEQGKSVLVTAQTNRALLEVAEKDMLHDLLESGGIHKTNMTLDEVEELKKLTPMKQMAAIPGQLVLSTYFISSGFAADLTKEGVFDYVIMDEASQALTAMFAAAAKIGKKSVWVGDSKQLSPIVALNKDIIKDKQYQPLIEGLRFLSSHCLIPNYQLSETFRFGQRAANYTSIFYANALSSRLQAKTFITESIRRILNPNGGPSLILTDLPMGDDCPKFAIDMATFLTNQLLKHNQKAEIAVLTCKVRTNKALQKQIMQHCGANTNVKIETIARVQGLTTDTTILVIPNNSYLFSMEKSLFNVATSRAREHTIIIADQGLLDYTYLHPEVKTFLQRLKEEQCIYISPNDNAALTS